MKTTNVQIGDRVVGPDEPCFVIAEVGVNHNGSLDLAKELVDASVAAGADAVKFQKRTLSEVYQQKFIDDPRQGEQALQYVLPILKEFELADEQFTALWEHCRQRGIMALCTPWDRSSTDFLTSLDIPAFKIGSPDMTNLPLLEYVASKGKPMIVSTGMSTEDEIRKTIAFLKQIDATCVLLHCVSTYPAAADETNLRVIEKLREWSGWPVGFSSHAIGHAVSLAATAVGACVIERHITLDNAMRGPDHAASLEPAAFAEEVRQIREVQKALGVPHRWMTRGELLNRRVLGKSVVAAVDIAEGALIESGMLTTKSPGLGISPQRIAEVIGQIALRRIQKDSVVLESDFISEGRPEPSRPIDIGARWGIVARLHDLDAILHRFHEQPPDLIEFHVSDRDLDAGLDAFRLRRHSQDLVVHAPEYNHDHLIDLCASDERIRRNSVARIQQSIDLARGLAPSFEGVGPLGPKIVIHVGGMSRGDENYDVAQGYEILGRSLQELRTDGVEFLLENQAPYPWYFGGRWLQHVMVDPDTTAQCCADHNLMMCFDTSHASLWCHDKGVSLMSYFERIRPYVRHLHVSDGAGLSGEGLQIGEGQINFAQLWPSLLKTSATMVPEIWLGHHHQGRGFQIALERLSEIAWATRAVAAAQVKAGRRELAEMIAPASSSVIETLRTIDGNTMGIAFVVDDQGVVRGVVTDGDVRRALLRGVSLQTPVADIATTDFTFAWDDATEDQLKALLSERHRVVPILDQGRRLTGFASFHSQQFHSVGLRA